MGLLRKLFGVSRERYQLDELVSARNLGCEFEGQQNLHIICDMDKTYLETEFESWVKMARIPFERPHEKITVPGASEVLQAVRWSHASSDPTGQQGRPYAGLHFVSSSPPQLRAALEGKLILDRLDWSSDTFKNQGYNLRMARIDLLRHHIAYKTKAILDIVSRLPDHSTIWMIGDNAEYDAFIYTGLRLFLESAVDRDGLGQWMSAAKVEKRVVAQVLHNERLPENRSIKVGGILIRELANYPRVSMLPLTQSIGMFVSWFQVAWLWMKHGLIHPNEWIKLVTCFHNLHGLPLAHLRFCFDEVSQSGETLPEEVRLAVQRALEFIARHGVVGKNILGWILDVNVESLPHASPPLNYAAVAKTWYHNIESARLKK